MLADHRDLPLLLRGGTLHMAGEPQSKRLATAKALAQFLERRPGVGVTMVDQSSIIAQLGADIGIGALLADKLLTLPLGDAFGLELIESFPDGQNTASGTRAMLLQSLSKHHGTVLPMLVKADHEGARSR